MNKIVASVFLIFVFIISPSISAVQEDILIGTALPSISGESMYIEIVNTGDVYKGNLNVSLVREPKITSIIELSIPTLLCYSMDITCDVLCHPLLLIFNRSTFYDKYFVGGVVEYHLYRTEIDSTGNQTLLWRETPPYGSYYFSFYDLKSGTYLGRSNNFNPQLISTSNEMYKIPVELSSSAVMPFM